jgi:hypothetical protein
MTPKEKAQELVDKMLYCYQGHIDEYTAKQCALIAVDVIINSSPSLPILGDGGYLYEDIELSTKYWQEVKQEIINL